MFKHDFNNLFRKKVKAEAKTDTIPERNDTVDSRRKPVGVKRQ